ncbi:MAG: TonB-dependent receptor plug domain-containing protein [Bacteroides sp.]
MKHTTFLKKSIIDSFGIKRVLLMLSLVGGLPVFSFQVSADQKDTIPLTKKSSMVTLHPSDFSTVKDYHLMNTLAGKVPGLDIYTNSNGVGAAPYVRIRGANALTFNSTPLYIVDGMPMFNFENRSYDAPYSFQIYDGMSCFDLEDIESVSVVKGFDPSQVFNSLSANGAILIQTKRGHVGKLRVNYVHSTMYNSPYMLPKFQQSYGPVSPTDAVSWGEKLTTRSAYDPTDFFQTGFTAMNTLSVSGGNRYNQTYASLGMANGQNLLPKDEIDRYNFMVRNTSNLFDGRLQIDLSGHYMKIKEKGSSRNLIPSLYLFPRGEKLNETKIGSQYVTDYATTDLQTGLPMDVWFQNYRTMNIHNPYWLINRCLDENNKKRYMLSGSLMLKVTDWMTLTARSRFDRVDMTDEQNESVNYPYYGLHHYLDNKYTLTFHQLALNFEKKFKRFALFGQLDFSSFTHQYIFDDVKYNFDNPRKMVESYSQQTNRIRNISSMLNVEYDNWFLLSMKKSWDIPAVDHLLFESDSKLSSTGISASFMLSDVFHLKSSVLSSLSLNAVYSEQCNYPEMSYFVHPTTSSLNKKKLYELSINGKLFDDKVEFALTGYKTITDLNEWLSSKDNSYLYSYQLQNKGLEAFINYRQNIGKDLWQSSLSFSLNRSLVEASQDLGAEYGFSSLKDGEEWGTLYGYDYVRDESGQIKVFPDHTLHRSEEPVKLGNINPKWQLGWSNTYSWKRFTFGLMLRARFGGICLSRTEANLDLYGVSERSGEARDNGGVWVSGQQIDAQNYFTLGSSIETNYVYSATNVRLGELSVAYDLPIENWVKFVKGLRLSFTGRNLLMLYCKAPFDPELTDSAQGNSLSIDRYMQPSLRSLGFTINARF